MDFIDLVNARHSVRAFTAQPVDDRQLEMILAAAAKAPSAGNLQAYEIYVVTSQKRRVALARAANGQEFLEQAPVSLVFCANPGRSEGRYGRRGTSLYCIQDATIACAYAQLAATELGLATVWVGAFNDNAVREVIGVDADLRPIAVLPIGWPAERPEPRARRPLSSLVHRVR